MLSDRKDDQNEKIAHTGKIPVKFPLLGIFCLIGIIILSISFFTTRVTQDRLLEDSLKDRVSSTQKLFMHQLENTNDLQMSILDELSNDSQLIDAFKSLDRARLAQSVQGPFEQLNSNFNITHLYFMNKSLEVFHRAHHPERYGDIIDRFTAKTSQNNGRASWGLELGRFGTLTLRTVIPWRDDGALIGYLEVGQEIDILFQNLKNILDHNLVISVNKSLLDEKDWIDGKSFRISSGQWNDAETYVIAGTTLDSIKPGVLQVINLHHSNKSETNLSFGSQQIAFLPIRDAAGDEIGELGVIADVVATNQRFLDGLYWGSLLSIIAGFIGFCIFWLFSTKIENALYKAQSELEELVEEKSQQYQQELEKVEYHSKFDKLTGLPNRTSAIAELLRCLKELSHENVNLTLIQVNIDGLGKVNDIYGHKEGDNALCAIAHRIRTVVPNQNMVARVESDEFLIIMDKVTSSAYAELYSQKILENCAKPIQLSFTQKTEISLSVRCGITIAPKDGTDEYLLLKNAHAATVWAKSKGGNTICFFTPRIELLSTKAHQIENQLRKAILNNELSLNYQPIYDLKALKIVGAEALLRWNNMDLGAVPPDEFIPVAESSGIIEQISKWVLAHALQDLPLMLENTQNKFRLAINLSANQFANPSLSEEIMSMLEEKKLAPGSIKLELTEGMLMKDKAMAAQIITALKEVGLECSLDDFGTGYSSLAYLKNFEVSSLKIDKSFVKDLSTDRQAKALVEAIITMAKGLNLPLIAEGIETEVQRDILNEWGCEYGQGYLFSKPVALNKFIDQLREDI